MVGVFHEKALIALHKYNCPISQDESGNLMVNVAVKRTINNDLVFTCPFCVSKRKKNLNPYANSKSVIHIHGGNCYGTRTPHCTLETYKFYNLPRFEFNLVENVNYVSSDYLKGNY